MQTWVTVIIVFVISFFLINSQAVNTRAPFYGREHMDSPFRNGFFLSEVAAAETILEIYGENITMDGFYTNEFIFGRGADEERFSQIDYGNEVVGLVVVRRYIYRHPPLSYASNISAFYNLLAGLEGPEYNAVYDAGDVKAYLETDRR